jgi:hypothetical protein
MALRNLTFPTITVDTPGGSFAVRGLTTDMVVGLYQRHRGELGTLFDDLTANAKNGSQADITNIVMGGLHTAPLIAAELVALASGSRPDDDAVEPDMPIEGSDETTNPDGATNWERDVQQARDLPFPVQVDALEKIAAQTFTSDMPAGKFLAVVIKMAGSATALLPK